MSLTVKSFSADEADMKKAECVVRLRIRENDVKSQVWRLMTNNSFEAVTEVEQEVAKIFADLDDMVMDIFDDIQGVRTRKAEEASAKNTDSE